MAYFNYLYSAPIARVEAFRLDQTESLQATRIIRVSHLIAYWVKVQPLGKLLGEAIDGGEILHSSLWHPFRAPKIHNRASVAELLPKLEAAWKTASANIDNPEED